MNYLPYPHGAYAIAQARALGKRPAGPVIVALSGDPGFDNAIVLADPATAYRWDWVKGLPNIVVTIGKGTRLGAILRDIHEAEPCQLDVIDTERALGWMVLFTKPRLKTVRWTQGMVRDWLGDGAWHQDIAEIKNLFGLATV